MKGASRTTIVIVGATIQLLISGCGGGGGGGLFGSLFGGGAESADIFASFASTGLGLFGGDLGDFTNFSSDTVGGDGVLDLLGDGGNDPGIVPNVATVHHPEPGTMALFGGGLAGAAALSRRRRKPSQSSTRS